MGPGRSLLLIATFLVGLAAFPGTDKPARPLWVVDDGYRVEIIVDPGSSRRQNTPTGAALDFATLFKANNIPGRVDLNSLRVVRFDPKTGRAVPSSPGAKAVEVPYQLTGDF